MRPSPATEFVSAAVDLAADLQRVASLDPEAEAELRRAGAPRVRLRTRPVARLWDATVAEADRDRRERAYAILALACRACELRGDGGRRGPRAKHLVAQVTAWQAWAPFGGRCSAQHVGELLQAFEGCASVCGLGVRQRERHDDHRRYATYEGLRTS